MTTRKNFRGRIKARRQSALERLEKKIKMLSENGSSGKLEKALEEAMNLKKKLN